MDWHEVAPDALTDVQELLSAPRLAPYRQATGGDLADALTLYTLNVQLSAAFYESLHYFEVGLRNRLDQQLSAWAATLDAASDAPTASASARDDTAAAGGRRDIALGPTPTGELPWYHALYADVYPDALRFVSRRLPSHAANSAEDIVADALLVAWRRFEDAPRHPEAQRAWVFGIARNCLLTSRRGSRRREALTVRLADHDDRGDPTSSSHDSVIASLDLTAAWQRLTPGEQEVLALTVFDDLTSVQAALVLGTTSTGYRLRLMRARRALRAHLADTSAPEPGTAPRHPHPFAHDTSKAS